MRLNRSLSARVLLLLLGVIGCLSVLTPRAEAQSATTGAIAGLVTDASGMYLPGVKVTLLNRSNNQSQSLTSDDMGRYNFSLLAPGTYEMTFAMSGYKTAQFAGVTVNVSEAPNVETSMEAGDGEGTCACKMSAIMSPGC